MCIVFCVWGLKVKGVEVDVILSLLGCRFSIEVMINREGYVGIVYT